MFTTRMRRALTIFALAAACATGAARAVAPGDAAPALSLPDTGGTTVALDKLKGRVVYVDFWASWCGPCKRSFPWMNEMHRKYGDQGLTVVAVNVDRKREDAAKFLAATPGAFTIVYDPAGGTPAAWQVKGMPTSYLVDRAGRIVAVDSGFRDDTKDDLEARIKAALAGK
jgi:thiol-disulfide isomerase/thioredoxin